MALLELNDVHTYYGAIHALRGVTLNVEEGEIVTLIGSNGAGKSTTLRTISGQLRPRQGEIKLRGERIDHRPPHEIVGFYLAMGAKIVALTLGEDGALIATREKRERLQPVKVKLVDATRPLSRRISNGSTGSFRGSRSA